MGISLKNDKAEKLARQVAAETGESLTEAIIREPGRLTTVLGDINEWFALARILRQLGAHFGRSSTARTWPSRWPLFALDRIWVHPPEALMSVWTHTSSTAQCASDHLPLVGIIRTED